MGIIFVFLYIIALSLFPCYYFNRSLAETMPFMLVSSILILYIFGFLQALQLGFYFLLIWAVASSIYTLWQVKKDLKIFIIKHFASPGFVVFCLLLVVFSIIFHNRLLSDWDDVAFWGPFIKETYRLGAFHNTIGTGVSVHLNYPPGSTLFAYQWLMLFGSISEAQTILSFHMLCSILMLPAVQGYAWKEWKRWFPAAIAVMIVPCVFFTSYLNSIYPDALLGIMFAHVIYIIWEMHTPNTFSIFRIVVSLSFLPIIKEMGLLFMLIGIGSLLIKVVFMLKISAVGYEQIWWRSKATIQRKFSIGIGFFACIIIPFIFWQSWTSHVRELPAQFSIGQLSISGLLDIINGTAPAYRYSIVNSFLHSILSSPHVPSGLSALLRLSYMPWLLIIYIFVHALNIFANPKKERRPLLWMNTCMFFGGIIYAGLILTMYLFGFNQYEGIRLASYTRYMNTYLVGYLGFSMMVFCQILSSTASKKTWKFFVGWRELLSGIILLLCIPYTIFYNAVRSFIPSNYGTERIMLQIDAAIIRKASVDLEQNKLYFISQNSSGYPYWTFKFELLPLQTNPNFTWSIGKSYGEEDVWTRAMTAEEFSQTLLSQRYTYVYLQFVDETFIQQFSSLFAQEDDIRSGQLFLVHNYNGKAILEGVRVT